MAATKAQPKAAPAEHKRADRAQQEDRRRAVPDRAESLTEDIFEEIEAGQRAAIKSVKQFIDTVDRTLPPQTEGPSGRQKVVDAAMEMADQLVHVQYDFLRKVVRSAGKSLSR